jgi:hypothetical protein
MVWFACALKSSVFDGTKMAVRVTATSSQSPQSENRNLALVDYGGVSTN